jgi:dienelactone hydrolase
MDLIRMDRPTLPASIPLYGETKQGADTEVWTLAMGHEHWIRNVSRPTLTPFLPKEGTANGAGVIVIPGGGFQFISISNEGWPIAQRLADRGVAAFVLKYRTEETPDDEAGFGRAMNERMAAFDDKATPPQSMIDATERAREDALVALKMVHDNAITWGLDAKRLGMLGFSAGAMTLMATNLTADETIRPNFLAPIYGPMTAVQVPVDPQPMFVSLAADDALFGNQGFGLIDSWKRGGGDVEFHLYSSGGHGFGSHKKGTTSDNWFEHFMAWMGDKGFV